MTDKDRELIDYVLDTFDFSRVANVMTHLNWTWHSTDGVPSEYELRQAVRRELKQMIARNVYSDHAIMSTGGFEYHVYREHGEVVYLEVKFVITCADADVNYFGE